MLQQQQQRRTLDSLLPSLSSRRNPALLAQGGFVRRSVARRQEERLCSRLTLDHGGNNWDRYTPITSDYSETHGKTIQSGRTNVPLVMSSLTSMRHSSYVSSGSTDANCRNSVLMTEKSYVT